MHRGAGGKILRMCELRKDARRVLLALSSRAPRESPLLLGSRGRLAPPVERRVARLRLDLRPVLRGAAGALCVLVSPESRDRENSRGRPKPRHSVAACDRDASLLGSRVECEPG